MYIIFLHIYKNLNENPEAYITQASYHTYTSDQIRWWASCVEGATALLPHY